MRVRDTNIAVGNIRIGAGCWLKIPGKVQSHESLLVKAKELGTQTLNMYGKTVEFTVVESLAELEVEVEQPVVESPANVEQSVVDALSTAGDLGMGEELVSAIDVTELQTTLELPEEAEKQLSEHM